MNFYDYCLHYIKKKTLFLHIHLQLSTVYTYFPGSHHSIFNNSTMKKIFAFLYLIVFFSISSSSQRIVSGVSWYDQNGAPVNAHGANMLNEGGRWWLFGEYKSDTTNAFGGFSCYSSTDLTSWTFERIALPVQSDGILGPNRVGERPKVLKCPSTGKYVMLMHTDDMQYKDQRTAVAVSDEINGEYRLVGPLKYHGKDLRHWDIGAFQDSDGKAYLLANHGPIYRLSDDYMSVDTMVCTIPGAGESPVMFRHQDTYYYITSNTTSWERNDNYYYTSQSVAGPWEKKGLLCPEGRLTWNSQCSYVVPIEVSDGTVYMYMGDRWSYPHQASAATYVWQPIRITDDGISIREYHSAWSPMSFYMERFESNCLRQEYHTEDDILFWGWKRKTPNFHSSDKSKKFEKKFRGTRVAFSGTTNVQSGYGRVSILSSNGDTIHTTLVDFYSLAPAHSIRYISPELPKGKYMLVVEPTGEGPVWYDKRENRYGSTGTGIDVHYLYMK